MANEEQVSFLNGCIKTGIKGIVTWNKWRRENPETKIDLRWTNLSYANLSYADLSYADLSYADLVEASLLEANLNWVTLRWANLKSAKFDGANFDRTLIGYTQFDDVDLSEVKGLETVIHDSPSTIGIDTIIRSKGQIPIEFLRGCGVPEPFIENIPFLIAAMQPIHFHSCFISHSSQDHSFADKLYNDLQNNGVRCWFAPHHLPIGAKIRPSIDQSIYLHDKLLLILSRHSLASQWVEQEVETALERERTEHRLILFPIRLDDEVMKIKTGWPLYLRNTRNIGDFTNQDTYHQSFQRLLRDLREEK